MTTASGQGGTQGGTQGGREFSLATSLDNLPVLTSEDSVQAAGSGLPLERSNLEPQTRIFVRAGRNLDGDVEAYTIVWGEILEVHE